jgi:hypothetical protein
VDYKISEFDPDFQYFRKNNLQIWGPIVQALQEIMKMLMHYLPVVVWISSRQLKIKAEEGLAYFTLQDILEMITNKD